MDGLCNGSWQMLRFQASKRGFEDGFGAAEFAQQLSGEARTEAWRQRKGDPAYVITGLHFPRGKARRDYGFAAAHVNAGYYVERKPRSRIVTE